MSFLKPRAYRCTTSFEPTRISRVSLVAASIRIDRHLKARNNASVVGAYTTQRQVTVDRIPRLTQLIQAKAPAHSLYADDARIRQLCRLLSRATHIGAEPIALG